MGLIILVMFCSGKILHIDFGDCFEASMNREKFPEKVHSRKYCIIIRFLMHMMAL